MNAHKFVAACGIEEAKLVLKKSPHSASCYRITPKGNCLYYKNENHEYQVYFPLGDEWWFSSIQENSEFSDLSELKQVVESLELINWYGSISSAKTTFKRKPDKSPLGMDGWDMLEKAIADYELVESYKEK